MATSDVITEQMTKVSNTTDSDIELWIEPLGDSVPMRCGETFEIISTSELGREVEIEFGKDSIRVHGWIKQISSVTPTGSRKRLWALPSA
jgi:hypothetical protein